MILDVDLKLTIVGNLDRIVSELEAAKEAIRWRHRFGDTKSLIEIFPRPGRRGDFVIEYRQGLPHLIVGDHCCEITWNFFVQSMADGWAGLSPEHMRKFWGDVEWRSSSDAKGD